MNGMRLCGTNVAHLHRYRGWDLKEVIALPDKPMFECPSCGYVSKNMPVLIPLKGHQ